MGRLTGGVGGGNTGTEGTIAVARLARKRKLNIQGKEAAVEAGPPGLLAGFGAVKPRQRPEDFKRMRKEVEEWIAAEALKEMEGG